ncbi:alpha/beta fold hydrolase [Marinobacterium lutimaris]|uniref:Epoxide hydrolase. Serine peptidase. MEROPS family S33 n=1 Tax=Marinobacterium lutimaris TaxID=568106 RepID=A0A1H5UNL7_9GAMM|nr:alpha/beta hydrolase [Marinobacterium lutimaris]SEF76614.1 epoxide hydrolase. Serine peptidase. MEROPS family S33 [Marinobacterium lutimaris]
MKPKELKIQVNGRALAGLEFGAQDAPVTIFAAHGWLDNAASFALLAPRLDGVRFIALDLPGHGRSDWRARGDWYAIWDYVLDLHAALDELQLDSVHLLGHSLGAGILSMLAAIEPHRVKSLVMLEGLGPLVQAPAEAREQMLRAVEWRRQPSKAPSVYRELERMVRARTFGRFPVGAAAAELLVSRGVESVEDGYRWSHDPRLLAPSVARMTELEVRSFFEQIVQPVLVCLADGGIATPVSRKRLEWLARLTLTEIKGGHHPHMEEVTLDAVVDSIAGFYRTIGIDSYREKAELCD